MEALKIHTQLDSDMIHIPIHPDMIGKNAEIIILVEDSNQTAQITVSSESERRSPGSARGKIQISDDFHLPLDEGTLMEFYK